jgi:hypothetical protein
MPEGSVTAILPEMSIAAGSGCRGLDSQSLGLGDGVPLRGGGA